MTIADLVKQAAIEAKKYGLRQSKEGVILSFVLHPDDVTNAILLAPVGQRGMLAFVPIGDDEQPDMAPDDAVPAASETAMDEPKEHRDRAITKSERSKQAYASASAGERAVTRAVLLAKDQRFLDWVGVSDDHEAAMVLRQSLGIQSRREIATNPDALNEFLALEERFRIDTHQEVDPRF